MKGDVSHRGISTSRLIPERINILGVGVSAINIDMAIDILDKWVNARQSHYVCVTSVHGVVESQSDQSLRKILNQAGLVTPDGMPLVWVCHLRNQPHVNRVYGPDLMSDVCSESVAKGYRHFLYGGAAGVPELLAEELRHRFPGIQIVGHYSPPFRPLTTEEDDAIVQQINESEADIVWVGLSTPKQEYWMSAHVERLNPPVIVGVGAAFDFLAGLKAQAPRWIQRSGLEWLYRLLTEPQRLWRRYLKIVPLFLFYIILEFLGLRDRQDPVDSITS